MPDFHGMPCWYELATSDLAKAQVFYTAIVGWTWTDPKMQGMTYMLGAAGAAMVSGAMQAMDGQPVAWSIYFAVNDCDATAAQATDLGAKLIVPPADIPNTGRFAILLDPQGAAFAMLQPLPTDGAGSQAFSAQDIGHGNWQDLVTSDPAAAMAFYEQLFGWKISRSLEMGPGMTYHLIARQGQDIGGTFAAPGAPFWKAYFGVTSVKTAAEAVTAGGGTVTRGPDPIPGGSFTLQIKDPQGAVLALVGPA